MEFRLSASANPTFTCGSISSGSYTNTIYYDTSYLTLLKDGDNKLDFTFDGVSPSTQWDGMDTSYLNMDTVFDFSSKWWLKCPTDHDEYYILVWNFTTSSWDESTKISNPSGHGATGGYHYYDNPVQHIQNGQIKVRVANGRALGKPLAPNTSGTFLVDLLELYVYDIEKRYWVGGTGNWHDPSSWALTSGGTGGLPSPWFNDDIYFDVNSFSGVGQTVTVNSPGASYKVVSYAGCKSMDWTGATGNPILDLTTYNMNIAGSLKLIPEMSLTSAGVDVWDEGWYFGDGFEGGDFTVDFADHLLTGTVGFYDITFEDEMVLKWTFLSDIILPNKDEAEFYADATWGKVILDFNNHNVSAAVIDFSTTWDDVMTVYLGNGKFTVFGTGTVDGWWWVDNNIELYSEDCDIEFNTTIAAAEWVSFYDLRDSCHYKSIIFNVIPSDPDSSVHIEINESIIDNLEVNFIGGGGSFYKETYDFGGEYTTAVGRFVFDGVDGNLNYWEGEGIGYPSFSKSSGYVQINYCTLEDVSVTGPGIWYACNCVDTILVGGFDFVVTGNEQVTNGGFDGNANGWTVSGGASYNNGRMIPGASAGSMNQYVGELLVGKYYRLSLDNTLNSYGWGINNCTTSGFATIDGKKVARLTPRAGCNGILTWNFTAGSTGYVDNFSVKEVIYVNSSNEGFLFECRSTNYFTLEGEPTETGVYTLGSHSKNYPLVLDFTYPISERDGSDFVLNDVEIGSIMVDGNDFYVTWKREDGGVYTYGIDKVDYSNKLNGAYFETRVMGGSRDVFENFTNFIFSYSEIPANCAIGISYSEDYGTNWIAGTVIKDVDRKIVSAEEGVEAFNLQLRATMTTSGDNSPSIEKGDIIQS